MYLSIVGDRWPLFPPRHLHSLHWWRRIFKGEGEGVLHALLRDGLLCLDRRSRVRPSSSPPATCKAVELLKELDA